MRTTIRSDHIQWWICSEPMHEEGIFASGIQLPEISDEKKYAVASATENTASAAMSPRRFGVNRYIRIAVFSASSVRMMGGISFSITFFWIVRASRYNKRRNA